METGRSNIVRTSLHKVGAHSALPIVPVVTIQLKLIAQLVSPCLTVGYGSYAINSRNFVSFSLIDYSVIQLHRLYTSNDRTTLNDELERM
jgi:hypothetical protein